MCTAKNTGDDELVIANFIGKNYSGPSVIGQPQ